MVNFWLVVAATALIAVIFVVWPLWRRSRYVPAASAVERKEVVLVLFNEQLLALENQLAAGELEQAQFEQLKEELELSLLEDISETETAVRGGSRVLIYLAAVLLPLAALGFYWQQGFLDDVRIAQLRDAYFQQEVSTAAQQQEADIKLDALVAGLEAGLQNKPDNAGNRYLLARSYMQQGEFVKAVGAYTHIVQHHEAPPHILGELAQAVFLASGNRMTQEVELLATKALEKDPDETTSLGLAGIAAFERGQYSRAIELWGHAVELLGAHTSAARSLQAGIDRARNMQTQTPGPLVLRNPGGQTSDGQASADPSAAAGLTVSVSVAPGVEVNPQDSVFVYARAWQGPKMPLAIRRLTVAELPAEVVLDESMAMAPGMTITSFPQLEVVARISKSGAPEAQSGDWQGSLGPVVLAELNGSLSLTVDQQLP